MDTKKHTPKPRRFRVERLDTGYGILDTEIVRVRLYSPFWTRVQAEQQCVKYNATRYRPLEHCDGAGVDAQIQARHTRVVQEWFERHRLPLDGAGDFGAYRTWLPQMLRAWSNTIAAQCGYGGTKRSSLHTYIAIKILDRELDTFAFAPGPSKVLHWSVWPIFRMWDVSPIELELRKSLAVHYLSADPDHVKAGYFGLKERAYQNRVAAAHRMVASDLAA